MAAAVMDPGKYPIVLSEALLKRAAAKEVYTGIRYNHKAEPASDSSSGSMKLQPSEADPIAYDLSFSNSSDKYTYQGMRTKGDGKYVLIFDPAREVYVLHQVDSTFDMNLISTPWNQNASDLRSQYAQLGPESKPASAPQRRASKATKKAPAPKAAPKAEPARRKQEKAKKPKPPPVREPTPEEDEDEKADDSGDELEIEWGDSAPPEYQSTPLFRTDPSEHGSDEDAEGEEYEEEPNQDVDHLKLPSPVNNNGGSASEDEMELDLEAELEQELEQALSSAEVGNESSESEEE